MYNFVADVFHTVAGVSSVIFSLHWQIFADAKIFELKRLDKVQVMLCLCYLQYRKRHSSI